MSERKLSIFERLLNGETISFSDENYALIDIACAETRKLVMELNLETDAEKVNALLCAITGTKVDKSVAFFSPLQINYGKNLKLGKNIFINTNCSLLDLGGITIDDDVLIAPGVSISSEGHPVSIKDRKKLTTAPVHIKRNVWIGTNVSVLPGVTIGENAVVAAGAVVNKDIPDNAIVAGIPAKIIRYIDKDD